MKEIFLLPTTRKRSIGNLVLISALLIPILSFTQSLKTYNGPFSATFDEQGKAVYTYYDDGQTQERIKEGAFRYTGSLVDNMKGNFARSIIGSFKKGLKNGLWSYTLTYKDFERSVMRNDAAFHYNATGTITVKANYKDGLPDGQWSYVASLKQRDKYRYRNAITFSPYKELSSSTITVSFKKGVITGPASIKVKGLSGTGQFGTDGSMEGNWLFTSPEQEDQIAYIHGGVTRIVKRLLPSGKLIENYTESASSRIVREKVNSGFNADSTAANGYELMQSNFLAADFAFMLELFNDDNDFLHSKIGGDLSLSIDSYGEITDKRKGGYYFMLKPIEYYSLEGSNEYAEAEAAHKVGNCGNALPLYMQLVTKKLRPADMKAIMAKARYCDSTMAMQKKKASLDYLPNGLEYYRSLKQEAETQYLKDTNRYYYTKWVQQANGTQQPVRTLHEVLRLQASSMKQLVTRFCEMQEATYSSAVAGIDWSMTEKELNSKYGYLTDYQGEYIKLTDPMKKFFDAELDMFEAIKKQGTSTSVIADIQFAKPVLGSAYLACRETLFNMLPSIKSPQELNSMLQRLERTVSFARYSLDIPELPAGTDPCSILKASN